MRLTNIYLNFAQFFETMNGFSDESLYYTPLKNIYFHVSFHSRSTLSTRPIFSSVTSGTKNPVRTRTSLSVPASGRVHEVRLCRTLPGTPVPARIPERFGSLRGSTGFGEEDGIAVDTGGQYWKMRGRKGR